jgi:hypothetical protein
LAPLASSPALAMSPFPSSLDLAFSSSGIITPQFTLYALARMHAFKPGKATGREAYLHFPLHPPCPRLHRLLPLGNPCSAPHSPRLHPRPSLLPAKHFQVSRDRRQRTCAPHANQRTHQHLSATATEMKPSACTRNDAQAYTHAFSDPLAQSKQLAPPFCRHPSLILMSRSLEPTTIDRGVLYRCRLGRSRCCTHAQMSERFCTTCMAAES